MKLTICNKAHLSDMPPALESKIKDRLTVENPVYRDNEKMGRWNGETPEFQYHYTVPTPGELITPRGIVRQLADLETEEVFYNSKVDPRVNLIDSGATEEEAAFLRSGGRPKYWEGRRVELNAMTSKQLIDWLEKKLQDHGVKKVVPDVDVLKKAYVNAYKAAKIREEVHKIVSQFDEKVQIPDDLRSQIEKSINGTARSWDGAIKQFARNQQIS